jgi:peptide/nickel transport system substrate-binding protein
MTNQFQIGFKSNICGAFMTTFKLFATVSCIALSTASAAHAQELRIGLQSDADVLDPDQSRTFVGEIVFTSLCDKLVDITPDL